MGSFAEAKSCCDKYGASEVILLFADVKMEDEDLYRFRDDVIGFLGCEYVELSLGLTPWELFEKERFVGNSRLDICSKKLKRELLIGWIDANFGFDVETPLVNYKGDKLINKVTELPITHTVRHVNAECHLGIDYSEAHRLTEVQKRMFPKVYRSTLVEEGRIIPKDYSEQFGIKKPRLYSMGFGHNNCGGFCVKAGLGHFKTLYEQMPARYKLHEQTEQRLAQEYQTKPFLSKTVKRQKIYLTMKEYREQYLEKGEAEEDKWDIGGCACALP